MQWPCWLWHLSSPFAHVLWPWWHVPAGWQFLSTRGVIFGSRSITQHPSDPSQPGFSVLPGQHWRRHHTEMMLFQFTGLLFSSPLCLKTCERKSRAPLSWGITDKSQQEWMQQAGRGAVGLLSPLAWLPWAGSAPLVCGAVQGDTAEMSVLSSAVHSLISSHQSLGSGDTVPMWVIGSHCMERDGSYQGGNHWCQTPAQFTSGECFSSSQVCSEGDGRFRTEHNPCYQMAIMRANTCLYSFWAGCWAGNTTVQDVEWRTAGFHNIFPERV